jgi:hypothetical protein
VVLWSDVHTGFMWQIIIQIGERCCSLYSEIFGKRFNSRPNIFHELFTHAAEDEVRNLFVIDEVYFLLSGFLNKQNCHYTVERLRIRPEIPLTP